MQVIRDELAELRQEFGDERRTVIQASQEDLDVLDLIEPEDVVVTMSHAGYAKRQPISIYRAQKRGGKGRMATAIKEEDFVEKLWIANTHDTLLAFTSAGRVLWLRVHKIPDAGPGSRGKPIVNLLPLEANEKVQAILPVRDFPEDRYVFFSTRNGTVKKTPLSDYSRPRAERQYARSIWTTTMDWSTSPSPTVRAMCSCSRATAKRCVSPKTKCVRWAAPRTACAAFV